MELHYTITYIMCIICNSTRSSCIKKIPRKARSAREGKPSLSTNAAAWAVSRSARETAPWFTPFCIYAIIQNKIHKYTITWKILFIHVSWLREILKDINIKVFNASIPAGETDPKPYCPIKVLCIFHEKMSLWLKYFQMYHQLCCSVELNYFSSGELSYVCHLGAVSQTEAKLHY